MTRKRRATRPGENLTAQQRKAAEIFATNDVHGMTVAEVAKAVGVSERTLYRWKQNRDFIAYQNEIAETCMEDFLAEAYNVLKGLTRRGRSEHVKIKALELVLKNRGKLTDVQKVEATVEDNRTNEAIEEDIARLQQELAELEGKINKEE